MVEKGSRELNIRLFSTTQVVAVAVGGALGSVLRFGASGWVHGFLGRSFPFGTLLVNVVGCLAMGFLFVWFLERMADAAVWRAGVLIGLLGGFTTFSAFSMETFTLFEDGFYARAVLNVIANVTLCLIATWVGVWWGRSL